MGARTILCTLFCWMLFLIEVEAQPSADHSIANPKPPNILLIMADDLGHDDLSIHHHPDIQTPNIDALATQSVRFIDFAVTPVCSTTRAALLTGKHPYKTGVSGVHGGRDFLNLDETLLSEFLQRSGYQTGTWGKWHVGKTAGYFPWDRGFDDAYYSELYQHENNYGWHNGKYAEHHTWASEVVTDYAINFMSSSNAPFFAYVNYLAPHEPWLAPEQYTKRFLDAGYRPAIANLYGMIEEMDAQIGRLISYLEQSKQLENTLVIFLSDNGPWWDSSNFGSMTESEWQARNPSRYKGNKGQTWQNGIKSPLFFHLPSRFKPANVDRYVDVKDILPTLLEIVGSPAINNHSVDGISFYPYLLGDTEGDNPRQMLIASHDLQSRKAHFNQWTPVDNAARQQIHTEEQIIGLRTERYKLILNPAMDDAAYPQPVDNYLLFDMQNDPLETTNLFVTQQQVAIQMQAALEKAFDDILAHANSFKTPEYQVGRSDSVTVINGFGPSSTAGNTHSKAHQLSGLKAHGDGATYHLNVIESGEYELYIKQLNTDAVGMVLKLTVGEQTSTVELNGEAIQHLGTFQLNVGPTVLGITIQGSNSKKSWAEISGLRRFLIATKEHVNLIHNHKYPH